MGRLFSYLMIFRFCANDQWLFLPRFLVCMDRVHFIQFLYSDNLLGYNIFMFVVLGVGLLTGGGMGGPFLMPALCMK